MGLTISADHPHFPEGEILSVGGVLAVPNKGQLEVDEETEQLFIDQNEVSIEHYIGEENGVLNVSGTAAVKWSPPVEQAEEGAAGYMQKQSDVIDAALDSEGGET